MPKYMDARGHNADAHHGGNHGDPELSENLRSSSQAPLRANAAAGIDQRAFCLSSLTDNLLDPVPHGP